MKPDKYITAEYIANGQTITGKGKTTIILAPVKSLSVEGFTFPFSNMAKIRSALKLQAMPFMSAGEAEIFPVLTSHEGRTVSGVAWYISPEEFIETGGKVWPSPLPFVSKLEAGNGVTMWVDGENVSSILWQKFTPMMYRWKPRAEDTADKELAFYERYCEAKGLERGETYTVDAQNIPDDLAQTVADSVNVCTWIDDLNLSRTVLEGAKEQERTVKTLTKAAVILIISGILVLTGQFLTFTKLENELASTRSRSEEYYRTTFEPDRKGRISNPVNLARDKIASMTGNDDEGHPIDEVLGDLGRIFTEEGLKGAVIDIIRYNGEGFDCTGTAPDMTTVLNFRKSCESLNKAGLVQVDNTQFVSGIGYRFDLRVRW
ncbi:MAG: hypothetical protein IJM47_02795 [Synergistaceae bacterium]|nr:hypothetical protein [Synergistaceae bacterium]